MSEKSKANKGYTNPALQAMGIPRLRIPSRNWMIFWTVTGSIAGLVMYDRYERNKIRQAWKARVAHLSTQPMDPLQMPRRVTVYVAPPPGDYLEVAMSHFKQYVKPVLQASATDYVVRSESQQGEIRNRVAEEIRNRRRKHLGLPVVGDESKPAKDELDDKIESKLAHDSTGGVICIGRGAYKEYMNGLHEGWLGPLEPPKEVEALEINENMNEPFPDKEQDMKDVMGQLEAPENELKTVSDTSSENKDKEKEDESEKEEKKKKPVPKPYIRSSQYNGLATPTEFQQATSQGILTQPIAVIHHPHIMGFLNTPTRIYRFLTRRYLADKIGSQTAAVVFASTRPFDSNEDPNLCNIEELDWPTKWKQKGLDQDSEWMREFAVDPRIASNLQVYELKQNEN